MALVYAVTFAGVALLASLVVEIYGPRRRKCPMGDPLRDIASLKAFRDDITSVLEDIPAAAVAAFTDKLRSEFRQSLAEMEDRIMDALDQVNQKVAGLAADFKQTSDTQDEMLAELDAAVKRVQDDLKGLQDQRTDNMATIDQQKAKIAQLQAQVDSAPGNVDTTDLQAQIEALRAANADIQAKDAQILARIKALDPTRPDVLPPTPVEVPPGAVTVDDAASPVVHPPQDDATTPVDVAPATDPTDPAAPSDAPEGDVPTPKATRRPSR